MLLLYRVVTLLALPVLLCRFVLRGIRNPDYFSRIGERFGFSDVDPKPDGYWIHAVSVGEVNAAEPLVEALFARWPDRSVTITTMTTTGSDRVTRLFGDRVSHCYLPYDYPWAVSRFIEQVKPALGMVMETEIWPNLIHYCARRGVPLLYTNVRMSARSAAGYRRFRGLFKPVLQRIELLAAQTDADAQRLIELGAEAERVRVTGSLKFEMNLPASVREMGDAIRRQIGPNRPVFVAASTHEGEEAIVLNVHRTLLGSTPDLLTIIVPRHPERFGSVAKLVQRAGLKMIRRSEMSGPLAADTAVLVVDTMGELPVFLSAGDVIFMGGSLVETGGHNPLEPAALARPVVFGPHMFNFAEIANQFLQQGAGLQVQDADELSTVVGRLLIDSVLRQQYGNQGMKLIEQNRGALGKVISMVDDLAGDDSSEFRGPGTTV